MGGDLGLSGSVYSPEKGKSLAWAHKPRAGSLCKIRPTPLKAALGVDVQDVDDQDKRAMRVVQPGLAKRRDSCFHLPGAEQLPLIHSPTESGPEQGGPTSSLQLPTPGNCGRGQS